MIYQALKRIPADTELFCVIVKKKKRNAPPLGIEPRTWRLTAARSANGALEAWHSYDQYAIQLAIFSRDRPMFGLEKNIPRPGFEPGSHG